LCQKYAPRLNFYHHEYQCYKSYYLKSFYIEKKTNVSKNGRKTLFSNFKTIQVWKTKITWLTTAIIIWRWWKTVAAKKKSELLRDKVILVYYITICGELLVTDCGDGPHIILYSCTQKRWLVPCVRQVHLHCRPGRIWLTAACSLRGRSRPRGVLAVSRILCKIIPVRDFLLSGSPFLVFSWNLYGR